MSKHTLVTCLGAATANKGYAAVEHRFPDGKTCSSSFVGYSLLEHERPERLVVLGTTGSDWFELYKACPEESRARLEPLADRVFEAVEARTVDIELLKELEAGLSEELGVEVILDLIGTAVEEDEQQALIQTLLKAVSDSESLSLDVTHGYRHLPMLLLMAAFCLRVLKPGMTIAAIWYARLEGRQTARMHNLGGLLHFADWMLAMQENDLTGGFSSIARLVDDPELASAMQNSGYYLSVHQDAGARSEASRALRKLGESPLQGAGALFQPKLMDRLDWFAGWPLYQRQREQAVQALQRQDYLRAALFGFEAYISRRVRLDCGDGADPVDGDIRFETKARYEARWDDNQDWNDYRLLRDIRNAVTHGGDAGGPQAQNALASAESLHHVLRGLFQRMLPPWRPGGAAQ